MEKNRKRISKRGEKRFKREVGGASNCVTVEVTQWIAKISLTRLIAKGQTFSALFKDQLFCFSSTTECGDIAHRNQRNMTRIRAMGSSLFYKFQTRGKET